MKQARQVRVGAWCMKFFLEVVLYYMAVDGVIHMHNTDVLHALATSLATVGEWW